MNSGTRCPKSSSDDDQQRQEGAKRQARRSRSPGAHGAARHRPISCNRPRRARIDRQRTASEVTMMTTPMQAAGPHCCSVKASCT